jgi:predicted HD phosphohydrolase
MRARDVLSQLGSAVAYQISILPAQTRWLLGLSRPGPLPLDPASVTAPDSAVAREAEALSREASPPAIFNHCLRSYLWGRLLAARHGVKLDDEFFYVACLLHDLGLTERYAGGPASIHCFTLRSAEPARALVEKAGWNAARCDALAEAITLHVNVHVGKPHPPEARFLNASTALDVTGLRCWEFPPETMRAILARHRRLGLKAVILRAWNAEAKARPASRAAFLNRYLWFNRRIRGAPFEG